MTFTARIIAAATVASALAFAPAAFAGTWTAAKPTPAARHDCGHWADCGCQRVGAPGKSTESSRDARDDRAPGSNGYTVSEVPQFTDAG